MKTKDPIRKRMQAQQIKRLSETFLGHKNFSWWALFYASLIFVVAGWLPDRIADLAPFVKTWLPDTLAKVKWSPKIAQHTELV